MNALDEVPDCSDTLFESGECLANYLDSTFPIASIKSDNSPHYNLLVFSWAIF